MDAGQGSVHRQFFDKVMKNGHTDFQTHNAGKFVAAILEYKDPAELLYRMTSTQVLSSHCVQKGTACVRRKATCLHKSTMVERITAECQSKCICVSSESVVEHPSRTRVLVIFAEQAKGF